ncbi:DUF2975 domain-containing protein [Agarilytica rhodophyticola]|uniref:DUF2975 domain-containing protein n=1 Tax=Agarilytica rhodophyticola TaxID=1737490 RepID=UPI000B34765B|nr:DUF2975 domain-containing protein [Agarilytica rhodophyticola]
MTIKITTKHQQFAHVLSYLTLFGALMLPLMAATIWLFWNQLAPFASLNLHHIFDLRQLSVGERLAGFTVSLIGATIQAYGLLGLRKTFCEAAANKPLSEQAIYGFRRFAWVTLTMVFIGVAQRTGLIIIFSLSDPAQQGMLDIQLGTEELKSLFMGLLLVFVAHIFAEGKKAKDENEAFL